MRRLAQPLTLFKFAGPLFAGLLCGCTGTGVFFDHTFQSWEQNPNTPAGSSETFLEIRGEAVNIQPLLPETGNVWPDNTKPDTTLEDIQKQQADEIRKGGGAGAGLGQPSLAPGGPAGAVGRANGADQGLPPPRIPAPPPGTRSPLVQTPSGPALNVTGGGPKNGYRQLQNAAPSAGTGAGSGTSSGTAAPPGTGSILVPNGNGTSTLIGPDGSVQTVPTKP